MLRHCGIRCFARCFTQPSDVQYLPIPYPFGLSVQDACELLLCPKVSGLGILGQSYIVDVTDFRTTKCQECPKRERPPHAGTAAAAPLQIDHDSTPSSNKDLDSLSTSLITFYTRASVCLDQHEQPTVLSTVVCDAIDLPAILHPTAALNDTTIRGSFLTLYIGPKSLAIRAV